ncbi:MAG: LysM peptidoglycan-binding domain-containing protein [Planctomycetaceae bacterium]|nr:LysM peptidoglycan-binding domain-containing protein [Planctomycetaceae bacterium]
MSKPELPKKIESLPASPPATGKKTGWEPPSPQKVRTSETRMGILLAFCLLAAIGFVAYRKLDEKRDKATNAAEFVAAGDTQTGSGDSPSQESSGAHDKPLPTPSGPTPVAALSNWAAERQQEPAPSSTPAGLQFSSSDLPDQSEPGATSADAPTESGARFDSSTTDNTAVASDSASTFDPLPGDFGSEPQPAVPPLAEDEYNPFAGSETVADTNAPAGDANPFATASDAGHGQQTFSGDASTPSNDAGSSLGTVDQEFAAADNGLTQSEPSLSMEDVTTSSDADIVELPVMDLSQDVAVSESLPDQQSEPGSQSTAENSPWGGAPAGGLETPVIADANPPELLEPNDPQEMPTLTLGPFDAPAESPESREQHTEQPPVAASSDFDPFPTATATTDVRQPAVEPAPAEADPFGASEPTTVTSRTTTTQRDPFTPARDVSQAVREDEVLVHDVTSGENFWSIAQQHYGAGKYFNALAAYNQSRIPDPRRMRPGMKVLVPSKDTLAQQYPQLVSGDSSQYVPTPNGPAGFSLDAQGRPQFRVATGDTLSDIAEKHLGRASRWRQVYGMNRDQLPDENSLTTGMILRLPSDATQVRMDPPRAPGR